MKQTKVDSSYIQSLRYDQASRILRVRFNDGAVVAYRDVHPRTVQSVVTADSVGGKFIELVRDSHEFKILKQAA